MKTNRKIVSMALLLVLMFTLSPASASHANAAGCYWAQFIADVTIPDGTNFAPNTAFQKTWRIKNIGSCAWNSNDVSLIFDSGERMNAPASLALPTTVQPGQTVDITVSMTSPNPAGHYFGYWKLSSASGGVFGIGSRANRSFWVEIYVTNPVTAGYDFTANATSAIWTSGAGYVPFPGDSGSSNGFGLKQDAPVMENGLYAAKPGLLFVPNNVTNGYLQATYPAVRVQSGDRFQATIGCEYGVPSCYVAYGLYYQVGSGPIRTLWTFRERYEGMTYNVNLSLDSLANQDVKFMLSVSAYGSASGDRAVWVNPIIARAATQLPPPPPPAANLPDLLITKVYLGMTGVQSSPTGCIPNYGPFEIRVTVQNKGLTPAYSIPITELTSGTTLTIGVLQPGESIELMFAAGGSSYNFVIDPLNTIPETDKNNNKASYIPITPTPPVICTPVVTVTPSATPTPSPAPQTNALMVWQSTDSPCKTASFWQDRMAYGFCQPIGAPMTLVNTQLPDYVSRMSIWAKAYAPFTAQTAAGTLTFNGYGYVNATPAEQRMMAEWAARMYFEVPGNPTPVNGAVISSHFQSDLSCYDVFIYRDGKYQVSSCLPPEAGYYYPAPTGYLDENELLYFYRWIDKFQSFQETTTGESNTLESITFNGNGSAYPDLSQKVSIENLPLILESRAAGEVFNSGGGIPLPAFAAQWILSQQLGVQMIDIQVKNIESVNYPDACLGFGDANCEKTPVAGYKVQLVSNGMLYEFRTDSVGYDIRQYGSPQPVPAGGG